MIQKSVVIDSFKKYCIIRLVTYVADKGKARMAILIVFVFVENVKALKNGKFFKLILVRAKNTLYMYVYHSLPCRRPLLYVYRRTILTLLAPVYLYVYQCRLLCLYQALNHRIGN